ncbi:DUF397 domain-containing protein [Streptoalloteichus tenebrarius]|uniref:DUF397 domain-containing protein n=1 Tax=Streptoalloteichus tenebrarius (strain ATCC 17920 / DSM 40477 / JCM 4838 / CBS 697.72 / NBRC 16177 / NCIMB 11028 / NRRL B-12390 / A12253. 1 / ISP 5477) TaxID=1933 RepID=UPI0027E393D6|nr:DUF397 domain-containing protein [Streptoalloteichus tenebrarius]
MMHMASTSVTHLQGRDGWFKSSFSSSSTQCVEVKFDHGVVRVRDSKYRRNPAHNPSQEPMITVSTGEWNAFLYGLTHPPASSVVSSLLVETSEDGSVLLRCARGKTTLCFTEGEWTMFLAGVCAGEFFPAEVNPV